MRARRDLVHQYLPGAIDEHLHRQQPDQIQRLHDAMGDGLRSLVHYLGNPRRSQRHIKDVITMAVLHGVEGGNHAIRAPRHDDADFL